MKLSQAKGFEPLFRSSPFLDTIGPIFQKTEGSRLQVGIEILEKHLNGRGYVHAGVWMTLADIAMGYSLVFAQQAEAANWVTINQNTDFAGTARLGDWIEIEVDILKIGKQVAFVNAFFWKDNQRIVRVNAVFNAL